MDCTSLLLSTSTPHSGNPKKGVCPNGCRPETDCDITDHETPKETLLREAMEYIELYYHERGDEMTGVEGCATKEDRKKHVRKSIEETGTYEHTFDELQVSYILKMH